MGKRGKPPKSTAIKLARGTFRRGRDGARMDVQPPSGRPVRPAEFDQDASAAQLWDRIAVEHASRGTLGEVDTSALQSLCEQWSLYRKALAVAQTMPTDKDARISTLAYLATVDRLGAKFGWTASDRANLKLGGDAPSTSSVSSFARRRPS